MAQYSTGGFICLPGGYGTFEEMMEMITWNQVGPHSRAYAASQSSTDIPKLGIHSLPVLVLNSMSDS
jgi:hypothetical protein